jgi:hypothetical protein
MLSENLKIHSVQVSIQMLNYPLLNRNTNVEVCDATNATWLHKGSHQKKNFKPQTLYNSMRNVTPPIFKFPNSQIGSLIFKSSNCHII